MRRFSVGNLHSVALIDLNNRRRRISHRWEPSFCSLDRLNMLRIFTGVPVGNLHSVALIDLTAHDASTPHRWEPSFCSLDRLIRVPYYAFHLLGTFIL